MDIILSLLALFPSLLQSGETSDSSQTASTDVIEIQTKTNNNLLRLEDLEKESFKIICLV